MGIEKGLINPAPDDYLAYSLTLKPEELEIRDRLMDWLPGEIIDVHAHSNLPEHVLGLDPRTLSHMMSTFPSFSIEESREAKQLLFPGKRVRTLRFANAFRGIDHRAANDYLLGNTDDDNKAALYGIPDDVDYTVGRLSDPKVSGLKMYPAYFLPPAAKIYDYFRPEILEEAQARDIPIILHLPRMITHAREDLERTLQDFKRLRVVVVHLGLPHLMIPGLEEAYEELSKYENMVMDTAMIPSPEVVAFAIEKFGVGRIMYGSDEPLNLVRARVYENPELGQRLITEFPYHWVNKDEQDKYRELAEGVVHMHWSAILAIQTGLKRLGLDEDEAVEKIFRTNAVDFFKFTA